MINNRYLFQFLWQYYLYPFPFRPFRDQIMEIIRQSPSNSHRSELFQVINSTVSTMFLITHHIYQFMNLHILRICASFKENNYLFYDDNQKIIHKFSNESLRKLVDMLFPLKCLVKIEKKVPKIETKRKWRKKLTTQTKVKWSKNEWNKRIKRKTIRKGKRWMLQLKVKLTKAMYFKTFVRFLKLVFQDKINAQKITHEDINKCANAYLLEYASILANAFFLLISK